MDAIQSACQISPRARAGRRDSLHLSAAPGTNAMTTTAQADVASAYGHPGGRRSPKELLAASKPFQEERRGRSWFHFVETWLVFGALMAVLSGALAPLHPALGALWLRVPLAVFEGLVVVRPFILYHDYMNLAYLRGSSVAKWIFYAYGVYVMTPPNAWWQSHNYHHAHTAKIVGSHVGSYLMVTTDMWAKISPKERSQYKTLRHPALIFFAYFTVFAIGMCWSPFRRNPQKNWDSLLALGMQLAGNLAVFFFGWDVWLCAWFLPSSWRPWPAHTSSTRSTTSRRSTRDAPVAWSFGRSCIRATSRSHRVPQMARKRGVFADSSVRHAECSTRRRRFNHVHRSTLHRAPFSAPARDGGLCWRGPFRQRGARARRVLRP